MFYLLLSRDLCVGEIGRSLVVSSSGVIIGAISIPGMRRSLETREGSAEVKTYFDLQ